MSDGMLKKLGLESDFKSDMAGHVVETRAENLLTEIEWLRQRPLSWTKRRIILHVL